MARTWTDEQRELIESRGEGGPLLPRVAVAADAGAGKTSVLVERVKSIPSDKRVLCVSFTEKSKADLEQRLAECFNAEVYTIHGFCARVVSEFGSLIGMPPFFRILDADERADVFFRCFEKVYRRSPPASIEHGVDRFLTLCQHAAEVGPEARVHVLGREGASVASFVREVIADFEATKKLLRALEYSDLERFAAELLIRPEVAEALRGRYYHLFVDEFQDTSLTQCALVDALTGPRGHVFVVGDKKQSIYRFRGADVEVFERFVETLPEKRRLSWNFRSHREVIEAVNRVCAPVIESYGEMRAGRPDDRSELPDAIFDALPRVARVTCETDADGIEALLRDLRARGVDWSQVVLLLRRVKGNEDLLSELGRRGIGVAVTSSTSASSSEELASLLNLWIWAAEPWQKLRAARVAVDFELGPRGELDHQLAELRSPLKGRGPLTCDQALAALDERFGLHARFGAVYEQFELFILRHQSEGLLPQALARRLHHLLANGQDISGFVLLPPPANLAGTVRVLTVHSSKGLEFPVVILADVGKRRKRASGVLRRGADIWLPGRNEDGELDWSSEELKNARAFEEEAEEAESARLLYVAMTRAQEALYVVDRAPDPESAVAQSKSSKKPPKKPEASWSAWLKAGIVSTVSVDMLERKARADVGGKGSMPVAVATLAVLARSRSTALAPMPQAYVKARVGVTEYVGKSAAALDSQLGSHRSEQESFRLPGGAFRATTQQFTGDARAVGTEIHACLEHEDWEGLERVALKTGIDLLTFHEWRESKLGLIIFGKQVRAWPEFAFEWRVAPGTTLTGRVDRLVVTEDEAVIVDFKVLSSPRSREDLIASYAPQLKTYADAIKTLTKMPRVRALLLDVAAMTGQVAVEVPL